jgi:hypothetical protein
VRPALYLEYLDKEIAITGVLTAFSAAACAFALDRMGGAQSGTVFSRVWQYAAAWVLVGAGTALASALAFYMQRSHLAWLYGQIALSISAPAEFSDTPTLEWLREADSWATWVTYRWGFGLLFAALAVGAEACAVTVLPEMAPSPLLWPGSLPLLAVGTLICMSYVLRTYRYEDEPYKALVKSVFKRNGLRKAS